MRAAALAALESTGERKGEVSFTFVPIDEIASLNARFLGREGPTDVIAFDLGEEGRLLGDVYIAPAVASSNAVAEGEEVEREVLRLVIHGALHVIGMDHPEGPARETGPMWQLQEELLRSLPDG
ncbi:MAG: rRNA maturation RNase YbeY [marine benthic group bacterium]|nr:rRNA maturation RNase YbeY [Candidatus Benthicola marisminoris]